MTGQLAAAGRLRRLATAHGTGQPVATEDAAWLAAGLARYLEGASDGATLEETLELATPPGGSPWWRQERLLLRDQLLRQLAAPLAGTTAARAHAMALVLRRYVSAGWRHDRNSGAPTVPGRERELLFRLLSIDPDPPMSVRRLIDIIAG